MHKFIYRFLTTKDTFERKIKIFCKLVYMFFLIRKMNMFFYKDTGCTFKFKGVNQYMNRISFYHNGDYIGFVPISRDKINDTLSYKRIKYICLYYKNEK